ncbi:hypothetical protein [Bacteroides thetaiotaomicron]|uniref:hypothetical protein n=1 Tax=Bacteroides thetaiotaomicron TaxID=818 RepID=UPI001CE2E3F5|nr:hypothetical protein [Bacteroides thetaiotaomicron]MCA6005695.1 hypothetical protein [Bacteroides thetaiotaomicron]
MEIFIAAETLLGDKGKVYVARLALRSVQGFALEVVHDTQVVLRAASATAAFRKVDKPEQVCGICVRVFIVSLRIRFTSEELDYIAGGGAGKAELAS